MSTPRTHEFGDELLSAYLDNELTAAERAIVEQRLRTDERARQLLDDLRAASEAVKALPRPRLGRDLTAAVLNEIERQDPTIDRARVLAMPVRDEDTVPQSRPTGARGLVWASLAVAAALMLMVLRTEQPAPRNVATSEKVFDRLDGEGGAAAIGSGDPDRDTSDRDEGLASADISKVREPGASARAAIGEQADALTARGMPEDAPPAPAAATAEGESDASVESAGDSAVETISLAVAGDDITETFGSALADAQITLLAEELPSELATVVAAVRGSAADVGEEAYLVEATPQQIASVKAALKGDAASTYSGGAGATSAEGRTVRETLSRAWRVPADRNEAADSRVADLGAGRGGGSGRAADTTESVRVLFLLHRETE